MSKQLPTFPHKVWGLNCRPQRWEASVLPLHHHGPYFLTVLLKNKILPLNWFVDNFGGFVAGNDMTIIKTHFIMPETFKQIRTNN